MRWISLLCLPLLAIAASAQSPVQDEGPTIQVHRLNIISSDLPPSEAATVKAAVEGDSFPALEISPRIHQLLADEGYAHADVQIVNLYALLQSPPRGPTTVSVSVKAGAQYRLEAIVIEGASAFPAQEVLEQFPIHSGDLWSVTAIGTGLNRLNKFYVARGYLHVAVVPTEQTDEVRHTIVLRLSLREGEHTAAPQ
jgi:outer membrane protein assembly factor BamA